MIIIGYPGIGKSSIAKVNPFTCIDFDSSWMKVNGERSKDWHIVYCQIAEGLSRAGNNVFVSSHACVQKQLEGSKEHVIVIHPSLSIRDQWIERLRLRWEVTGEEANLKAWKRAEAHYETDIREIMESGFERFEINDMNYRLEGVMSIVEFGPRRPMIF